MAIRAALCLIPALWSVAVAAAGNWDFIVASPDKQAAYYADPKSLTVQGPIRRIRLLYDYKRPQPIPGTQDTIRSEVVLVSLDCDDRKFGMLQRMTYVQNMMEGAVVQK